MNDHDRILASQAQTDRTSDLHDTTVPTPQPPSVRFYRPCAALSELITSIYVVEVDRPFVDHLHPEWGNIRLIIRGNWTTRLLGSSTDVNRAATLYGPTDRTRRVETDGGAIVGIGLTPLGWLKLIDDDAAPYANRVVDLGNLLGVSGLALIDDLKNASEQSWIATLSALLQSRVKEVLREEGQVRAIHRALIADGHNSATLLEQATQLTERTLFRVCIRAFGFPPKRLLRRQRFLRALDSIGQEQTQSLGELLGDQYFDQSHFIREFRRYMGMTPTNYFRSPREALRRAAAERKRLIGASLQGLHPAVPPYSPTS